MKYFVFFIESVSIKSFLQYFLFSFLLRTAKLYFLYSITQQIRVGLSNLGNDPNNKVDEKLQEQTRNDSSKFTRTKKELNYEFILFKIEYT